MLVLVVLLAGCSDNENAISLPSSDETQKSSIAEPTDTEPVANEVFHSCIDENNDHWCDICGLTMGEHEAGDNKHACDYCGKIVSQCVDSNKNHECDVCGAIMGEHKTGASKHTCDYCSQMVSQCSGGVATCVSKAVCTICGNEYGEVNAENHDWASAWNKDGKNHWHKCNRTGCTAKKDEAAHSGGTATCTEKATCSECGEKYGEVNAENHAYGAWTSNGDKTHSKTCTNDSTHTVKEFCIDNNDDGKCNTCGAYISSLTQVDSDAFRFELNDDGESYCVTGAAVKPGTWLFIPSVYNEKPVTKIAAYAFQKYSTSIVKITIPEGVESIGEQAFYGCSNVLSVTIPSSVTTISRSAFGNCGKLASIVFAGTTAQWNAINKGMYWDNNTGNYMLMCMGSLTVSEGLVFELNADGNSYSVTGRGTCDNPDIIIPSNYNGKPVTEIADGAFEGESYLYSVVIPDTVTKIGDGAFKRCSLRNVVLPYGLTRIGNSAFGSCTFLTEIVIPDSVTSIGGGAFKDCTVLKSVVLSSNITTVSNYMFAACWSLTDIVIPDSVTSIGDGAFSTCKSLVSIEIPGGVTSIGEEAFMRCEKLTSIVIPDGITSIDYDTFCDCKNLESVVIPISIEKISTHAFTNCTKLANINYKGTKEQWNAIVKGNWYDTGNYTIRCTDGYIPK